MFHSDITFTLALIALVSGAFLILSSKTGPDIKTLPCRIIGHIVVIISLVILLFSGFLVIKKSVFVYQMHAGYMQAYKGHMMRPGGMPMHTQKDMIRMHRMSMPPIQKLEEPKR